MVRVLSTSAIWMDAAAPHAHAIDERRANVRQLVGLFAFTPNALLGVGQICKGWWWRRNQFNNSELVEDLVNKPLLQLRLEQSPRLQTKHLDIGRQGSPLCNQDAKDELVQ